MKIKQITKLAVVAALYIILTIINPFSYGDVQFRVSELLVLLCFYHRDYNYSLIIGCLIANIFGPMGLADAIFGTLATALSVFFISRSRNLFVASLYPVAFNGLIIGLELNFIMKFPLLPSIGWVAFGEFVVVSVVGVILFKILEQNDFFLDLIGAEQNLPFNEF